mgnify:CR=1 FL=1
MIKGKIVLKHPKASTVASSLHPDNLPNMKMEVSEDKIVLYLAMEKIGTLIATIDDFLANVKVAEEVTDVEVQES